MAKNSISKISNAFSTGGGGVNFEQQIQAMFLLSLLIDGFCPAMNEQTKKVHFQAKHLGYDVDDLVVITYRNQSEGKMACQIKHSITATEKDKTFQEVENEELRRGYYLGIINQRGVHWIDPEGKPELELAEDYENRANIAESRGYSRYADILRVIADEFKREAKRNILEARNGDDE